MCGKVRACVDSHRGANEAGAHDRKAARTPPNATERRLFGMIKPRRAAPPLDERESEASRARRAAAKTENRTGEKTVQNYEKRNFD